MKRFLVLFSLFFVLNCFASEKLTIFHYNDFHAANLPYKLIKSEKTVGGSAELYGLYTQEKAKAQNSIFLNAGDDFQGSPVSAITKGKSQIEILKVLKPDAFTLGNHEFDYGKDILQSYFENLNFPVLSANIWDKTKGKLFAPNPYTILERGNLKIGIIGLMAEDLPTLVVRKNIEGLTVLPIVETAKKYIEELKKQGVEFVVVLSHAGFEEDKRLAKEVPEIDVIIGGHSHTTIEIPQVVNGVIICQAGSQGRFLGKLDLEIENAKVVWHKGILIENEVGKISVDTVVVQKVSEFESLVSAELDQTIAKLETDWLKNWNAESNLGNWETDAIRKKFGCDVAFMNSGGLRKDLPKGEIKIRDFWEINPFGNTFVEFKILGEDLSKLVEFLTSGKSEEFMQVSGLFFDGKKLEVAEKPLVSNQTYTVFTNNYVTDHFYQYFGLSPEKFEFKNTGILDRDVFIEIARQEKVINSKVEGRIKSLK